MPAHFPGIIIQQAPMPVVRWLLAREPLTLKLLQSAAARGRVAVLRTALERGMTLAPEVFETAISHEAPEVIFLVPICAHPLCVCSSRIVCACAVNCRHLP